LALLFTPIIRSGSNPEQVSSTHLLTAFEFALQPFDRLDVLGFAPCCAQARLLRLPFDPERRIARNAHETSALRRPGFDKLAFSIWLDLHGGGLCKVGRAAIGLTGKHYFAYRPNFIL
jgi:hypothetical protein